MFSGSCLCGANRLTLRGALRSSRCCHCTNCHRCAGTAPAAWAMADTADLAIAPEGPVARYDSGRGIRCFCATCGSLLRFESIEHPEMMVITLGMLDGGDAPRPQMHPWTQSMPASRTIGDGLPPHRMSS